MTAQGKFYIACFVGAVVLWLALIAGLVTATCFAISLAAEPGGWLWGIWFPGAVVMALASAGVVALGTFVSDELERAS